MFMGEPLKARPGLTNVRVTLALGAKAEVDEIQLMATARRARIVLIVLILKFLNSKIDDERMEFLSMRVRKQVVNSCYD